ncbi:MAG: beta-lactamase family protein [Bdellovibrionaceae bacterium]|nr:beta-lactamase family protein [Pseudobdellovibrionaceae bacterium]
MALSKTAITKTLQAQLLKDVFVPLQESHKDLSLQMAVLYKNEQWKFSFGKSFKFFDLASLTKPIFAMSLCMYLEDRSPGFVSQTVSSHLPWFKFPKVKIKDLLAHQSGAPALYPVFEELKHDTLSGLAPLNLLIREVDFNMSEPVYSDVGFFILGAVLEEVFNRPLIEVFKDAHQGQMSSALTEAWGTMHFRMTGQKKEDSKNYAPTENCPLRHKVIQGEVHDESCWKMGGVSTHAGLFGSLEDVSQWVRVLNQVFQGNKFYSRKTISTFYKKQIGDWRLGLMVPSRPRSTAGETFSEASYGHLGFTGTSIWVDPKQDLSVVVLSNRTYPDRRINMLNQFRPHIHNLVAKVIKDNK